MVNPLEVTIWKQRTKEATESQKQCHSFSCLTGVNLSSTSLLLTQKEKKSICGSWNLDAIRKETKGNNIPSCSLNRANS